MATLEEILKLDSMSQVSDPKKSKTAAPVFQLLFSSSFGKQLRRWVPLASPDARQWHRRSR